MEGFVVPSILTGNSENDAGANPFATTTATSANLTNREVSVDTYNRNYLYIYQININQMSNCTEKIVNWLSH